MNLGAFMDPEFPIFSTTLCYLEREDAYLMLHRIKKQDDYNHDKWVGVGGKFERFESPEECLVREVREETGLDADPLPRPGTADLCVGQHDRVHPSLHRRRVDGRDDTGRCLRRRRIAVGEKV